MTYTNQDHHKIQQEAIRLYLEKVTDQELYPEHYQIKINRINSVLIDFDNIFAFGLDMGKQIKLCQFAKSNKIENTTLTEYFNIITN